MSLNRISALETFSFTPGEGNTNLNDRFSRRGSQASIRARKLSFNPLPEEWDPLPHSEDLIQAVGAFEVPKWKRVREY